MLQCQPRELVSEYSEHCTALSHRKCKGAVYLWVDCFLISGMCFLQMGHEADSKQRDPADNGAEPWQCQLASHSAAEGSAQREGSAADRSLLGDAYQRQGSSRKRKHGSPDSEPAHAAGGLPQIVSKTSAHSQHESFS